MIRLTAFISILFLVFNTSSGQTLSGGGTASVVFSESSLPIVVINTNGQTIKDTPKIIATMGIIYNGPGVRNHLTDPANEYNGKIGIEIRGSSSQSFPKKSYGFETRDSTGNGKRNVSIFGMPVEHDWILSANYTDKSFCRNVLAYQLSREMGHYAVRTKYVDVVLNGSHMGIYVFMETIKRDTNRVSISKLKRTEITSPDITGGYILKIDKTTGAGGTGWTSPYSPINHPNNQHIFLQYDYPSYDSIVPAQQAYIQAYVDSFEDALSGPNFRDSILGYSKYIGNGSWMDYFFCNELSKNVDGYRISSYLYKDKNKSLKAGPVWDYDIAWGNANYCSGFDTTGWAYLFPCTGDGYQVPFWWQKLLQDSNYTNEMKCRWTNYRQNVLSESHIFSAIDSIALLLNESKTWNFTKWPILGTYVWPNPAPQPTTYAGEIQNLKNWVHRRLIWIDSNLPGNCNCIITTAVHNVSCNSSCDGYAIALGTSPYKKSYEWNGGNENDTLFNLCTGNYSVTFKDAIGCTKTASVNITQPSVLSLSMNSTNTVCVGGCSGTAAVNASGGSSPYTYAWSNGSNTNVISSLCQGTFSVSVTDNHGCTKSSSVVVQNPNAPQVSLSSSTGVSCNGGSDGTAKVSATGGSGPYTYSWSPAGGSMSSASGLIAGSYTVTVSDSTGCSTPFIVNIPQPVSFSFSSNVVNAVCPGSTGSASVNVTGGTPPYNYSWTPGSAVIPVLTGVSPGTYSLHVTDAKGCLTSTSVSILQPPAFNFVSTTVPPSCFGGHNGYADAGASGGTGTLSYSWSPGGATGATANSLSAGTYTVVVTDSSNCSSSASVTIINPLPIILNATSTNATCGVNNGTATVSVINGHAPYSYYWSPSLSTNATVTNLNTGEHVVTVTDVLGCSAIDTVTVGSSSGVNVSISSQTDASCPGRHDASASLHVSGGASPYTYSWSPAGGTNSTASGLSAGVYTVSITESNACNTHYQLTISEPLPISIAVHATPATCYAGSDGKLAADVSGGTQPYNYMWSPVNQSAQSISNLLSGIYEVTVTDAHGCTASMSSAISQPLLLPVVINKTDASCNKANGTANAFVNGGTGTYYYFWSSGDTGNVAVNLSEGNYTVTITNQAGCTQTKNVVIGGTPSPVLSLGTSIPVKCNGGSNGTAAVVANGGNGSYTYVWTPNVSVNATADNLSAGIYSVKVTDAGQCTDSIGFILSQPAPLAALIFSENVKCYGGSDGTLYADAGGGTPPYFYSWTGGQQTDTALNLMAGTYSLVLTDLNNCTTHASGVIQQPDSMSIHLNVDHASCSACLDGRIISSVSGGVPPYSYAWQPFGQIQSSVTNIGQGNYTLCITDGNNCIKCESIDVNGGATGIKEVIQNSKVYVYPNPLNESTVFAFTLSMRQFVNISIYSSSGQLMQKVIHEELESGQQLINCNAADFSPGIYFYKFSSESHFQAGTLIVNK